MFCNTHWPFGPFWYFQSLTYYDFHFRNTRNKTIISIIKSLPPPSPPPTLTRSMCFASASNISLQMKAMSLYLFASASNISLLLPAISFNNFLLQVPKFLSICFFKINFRIIKFYLSAYGYLLFYSANLTAYSPFMSSFFFFENF